jgi:hypothetical protein
MNWIVIQRLGVLVCSNGRIRHEKMKVNEQLRPRIAVI